MAETGRKLQIRFGRSSSAQYKAAVRLAEQMSHCYTVGTDHIITVTPAAIKRDLPKIEKLWAIIGGWKTSKLLVDGEEKKAEVFGCLKCFAAHESAIIQSLHCKRTKEYAGWSCKKLLAVERHAALSSYPWDNRLWWYQVGYFKSPTLWVVDKETISDILHREADHLCLWLCPKFCWQKVQIHIDNLPDQIDLSGTQEWQIEHIKEPGFGNRPVGVAPVIEYAKIEGGEHD